MLINPKKSVELLNKEVKTAKLHFAMSPNDKISKLMIARGANAYALDDNLRPAGLEAVMPNEVKNISSRDSTKYHN